MSLQSENGRRSVPPPDDNKVRQVAHDQPPNTLFESLPESDEPQAQQLTAEGSEYLHRSLKPLEVDNRKIRKFVGRENSEDAARTHAQMTFNSDPARCNRRAIVSELFKSVEKQISDLEHLLRQWIDRRETTSWKKLVLSLRDEKFWQATTIPKLVMLVTFLALFLFGFAAELKNAVFMVVSSGLGFEADAFGALCFVFPIVVGPVLALKSLEHSLNAAGRQKFNQILNRVASPFALATVGLFAWTIGMMHSDVGLLASVAQSWTPPLWAILGCEMVLLALMGTMLAGFLRTALTTFFDYRPEPNAESVEVGQRAERMKTVLREMYGLRGQLSGVLNRLEGERQSFVEASVGELHRQNQVLLAKRAQTQLDSLDD